ncbi:MAG: SDR family oxidoreductase [Pseudobdellovibrionaceae bacterium]|nr:SDR family oxidoreductase [Pseudobdellovibrionaceae bacterium]
MSGFQGKVAVITGGSTGIGLATGRYLAAKGAHVILVARSEGDLIRAQQSIQGQVSIVPGDVSQPGSIRTLFQKISRITPTIDHLFVNAGIASFAPISDTSEELFDSLIDVNLKGAFFSIKEALPIFANGGSIVLNTSVMNVKGFPGSSVYASTKAALRSLARSLSADLHERGIRVNAVAPGPIETPIYEKLGMPQDHLDAFSQQVQQMVPLKRFGTPEEVAPAVAFLLSEESSYLVGVEIAVDGGISQL